MDRYEEYQKRFRKIEEWYRFMELEDGDWIAEINSVIEAFDDLYSLTEELLETIKPGSSPAPK